MTCERREKRKRKSKIIIAHGTVHSYLIEVFYAICYFFFFFWAFGRTKVGVFFMFDVLNVKNISFGTFKASTLSHLINLLSK